ncbi:MAG: diguanylate cyclase [Burkholderiales bacterium]|nr:MAG: diguanylate cyclase [Burkholderiales bacterium]
MGQAWVTVPLVKEGVADAGDIARRPVPGAPRRSEAWFRAMSDAFPLGIVAFDEQERCVYANAAYQRISGRAFEQTLGEKWGTAIHPEDRQRVVAQWRDAARAGEPFHTECRFLRGNGSVAWARVDGVAMRDGMELRGYVQTVDDITARRSVSSVSRAAELALFEQQRRAEVTLDSLGEAVLTTDLDGKVTYLNRMGETMTGWARQDATGRPLGEVFRIIDGATRQAVANPAQRAVDEDRSVAPAADCVLVRRDGLESAIEDSATPIHDPDGRVAGAVLVFHDVSRSLATALKMSHLAQHDSLTGLPNRSLLAERLSRAIGLARRHRKQVALLFLDLDCFKHVNDSLGHAIGDQLLRSVADRLAECVRDTDTVCRQGGDEFVILLAEIERPRDAASVAEKLRSALAVPHLIGGQEVHVTSSIGISVFPDDGVDVESVMQNADAAMYRAKATGGNHYEFFGADTNTRAGLLEFRHRT